MAVKVNPPKRKKVVSVTKPPVKKTKQPVEPKKQPVTVKKSTVGGKSKKIDKSNVRRVNAVKVDKKVKSKQDKYKMLTLRMYSYKIFNKLLKGNLDKRDPNLNGDSIQIGYSEVFTLSTVTRYYVISNLEDFTPVALLNYLIKEVKTGDYWVNLSMDVKNKNYRVDFEASNITTKLNVWSKILNEETEEVVTSIDGKQYTKNFDRSRFLRKTMRMFRSYYKLRENMNYTKESYLILKLQTRDKDTLKIADKRLKAILKRMDIGHYMVAGTLLDFLRGFSPISNRHTISTDTTQRVLMTNRDIADLIPYRQGKIGDFGLWFGIDKFSGSSVWLDIMNSPQAKNVLLMGFTGSGKTFYMQMLLLFHNSQKHNIFIHDHKGNEFTAFTKSVNGLVVSMTPSKTFYINTYKIPVQGISSVDELKGLFTESFALSQLIFLTITEPEPHEERSYKNIFNDFMQHVYRSVSVHSEEVESYVNTEQLEPEYLYKLFTEFISVGSTSVHETYGHKELHNINLALHRYWHPKGSRSEMFRNEINMDDINKNRVVCFDFGMAETTRGSVPQNEDKLKKIFMNIAASRFTNYNKKQKEWTVKVVEEIQSADEDVLKFTAADVTEGRAKNMVNYVLGNATGTLASGSPSAKNIIENMNIQILGKLSKEARDFYTEQFDLQKMRKNLDAISKRSEYKYCFLLNCNITNPPTTSVVEMVATPEVAESKYFKTVDFE